MPDYPGKNYAQTHIRKILSVLGKRIFLEQFTPKQISPHYLWSGKLSFTRNSLLGRSVLEHSSLSLGKPIDKTQREHFKIKDKKHKKKPQTTPNRNTPQKLHQRNHHLKGNPLRNVTLLEQFIFRKSPPFYFLPRKSSLKRNSLSKRPFPRHITF